MKFNQSDRLLFERIKRRLHSSTNRVNPTAYSTSAKLLWVGKHYLLVRSGPARYGRETDLWSREKLLIQQGSGGNAMMEIALATLDPALREWSANTRLRLHTVGSNYHVFRNRRWSKGLLAELIDHAKKSDNEFEIRLGVFKKRRAAEHAFSQGVCAYVENSGFQVNGVRERNGTTFPVGSHYSFKVLPNWDKKLTFQTRKDGTVRFTLKEAELDGPEFEILVEALQHIREKREFELSRGEVQA